MVIRLLLLTNYYLYSVINVGVSSSAYYRSYKCTVCYTIKDELEFNKYFKQHNSMKFLIAKRPNYLTKGAQLESITNKVLNKNNKAIMLMNDEIRNASLYS